MEPAFFAFACLAAPAIGGFVWSIASLRDRAPGAASRRVEQRIGSAARVALQREVAALRHRHGGVGGGWRAWLPAQLPGARRLQDLLAQAGSPVRASAVLGWSVSLGLIGVVMGAGLGWPAGAVAGCSLALLCAPFALLMKLVHRRRMRIEAQIPDALDLMARALQAGRALVSALRAVAQDAPQPIAGEFQAVADEINFGIGEDVALANLAQRVRVAELRYLVVALLIQREAGGNLGQILHRISALMRERIALRGAVRVMSAEGRLSAQIIGAMPFLLAGGISLVNPGFLRVLWTDSAGLTMLYGAGALLVCGAVWMAGIARIRV